MMINKKVGKSSRPRFLFQSIGFSWFLFGYSFESNFFYIFSVFYEKVIADDGPTGVDEIDQFGSFIDSELLLQQIEEGRIPIETALDSFDGFLDNGIMVKGEGLLVQFDSLQEAFARLKIDIYENDILGIVTCLNEV